jgi:hypothetical protein
MHYGIFSLTSMAITHLAVDDYILVQLALFWYFWLTIHNTTTSQAHSLFHVAGVFTSFPLERAALLLLLRQKYQKASLIQSDTQP